MHRRHMKEKGRRTGKGKSGFPIKAVGNDGEKKELDKSSNYDEEFPEVVAPFIGLTRQWGGVNQRKESDESGNYQRERNNVQ